MSTTATGALTPLRTWTVRAWQVFRIWRRSRPFWGGLFTLLAGLEILLIPWAPMDVIIRAGAGAMAGYIIGGVLALCGLMLWIQPVQRTFLSIVTILLGLAAFPFTNLGGFLIGTLLALVGGSLAFAWTPISSASSLPASPAVSPAGPSDAEPPAAEPVAESAEPATQSAEPVPVEPAVSAAPADSSPEKPQKSAQYRHVIGGFLLLLAISTAAVVAAGLPQPAEAARSPRQPFVAVGHSEIHARSQQMSGMRYDGVVELPTRKGPVKVLQFSMDRSQSTPFEMNTWDKAASKTLNQKSSQLTVSGNVKFYTNRFHGRLLGIPVTFTPDSPPPLVLPWMTFSNVEIQLVYLKCERLQADHMQTRYL